MSLSQEIQSALCTAVEALSLSSSTVTVEPASNTQFGDFSTTIAMQLFPTADKSQWNSPKQLAESIIEKLQEQGQLSAMIHSFSVAGPGFINFTVTQTVFTALLSKLITQEYDFKSVHDAQTAIVEYSSPNIAKPFTVGHLRSTIIGDAVANLLETTGYEVKRDNHLGDWGTQFGKLITAIMQMGEGSERANIARISSAEAPVKELVKLYVEFHDKAEKDPSLEEIAREWFTKLEKGDEKARELWQLCIDWSWTEFSAIYQELGVKFTENNGRGYGESFFEDKMDDVVSELEASGHLKTGEKGAKLFFFPDEELPPLMILKNDGSTLYATRDLATDKFRLSTYGRDILVINEVGAEQELYFRQIFRIEELLGWYKPGSRVHVKHGLYRFKDGKMSTRKGNTIWLEDVLVEAKNRALALSKEKNAETSTIVAIGSLKWNDLKRNSIQDITFDWDEILTMEGNSGAYIMYAIVRGKRVLEKGMNGHIDVTKLSELNASERALAGHLLYFEDTVKRAAREYAPQLLCTFLYTLAALFNSFYTSNRILGESEHETKRLILTKATVGVLEKGLSVLGIDIPAEM